MFCEISVCAVFLFLLYVNREQCHSAAAFPGESNLDDHRHELRHHMKITQNFRDEMTEFNLWHTFGCMAHRL